jgi:hypothetical protein
MGALLYSGKLDPRKLKITGRSTNNGYACVKVPGHPYAWSTGYVYAHRFAVEQKLGRFLKPDELVHHKNENKKCNRKSNLELKTKSSHARHHHPDQKVRVICAKCGKPFFRVASQLPGNRNGVKKSYCSTECRGVSRPGKLRHGTANTYSYHGCRCTLCRNGQRERIAAYREQK